MEALFTSPMAKADLIKERSIPELIEIMQSTRQMRRSDYNRVIDYLLSGQKVADAERSQMSRILDALKQGKVQLVD
jgi:predicted nucleic-acid-binding protein